MPSMSVFMHVFGYMHDCFVPGLVTLNVFYVHFVVGAIYQTYSAAKYIDLVQSLCAATCNAKIC